MVMKSSRTCWSSLRRMSASHCRCARELVADLFYLRPINSKDQQCTAPSFLGGRIAEEETIRLRSGMHTTPDGPTRSGRDGAWSTPVTHTAVIVGQHLAIGDLGTEQSRRELLAIAEMRESGLYFALIRLLSVHDS